ncbi:hypothetical protein HY992_00310 [Candidatus Micrarchaeota archaeon]|nr:hypothetical protein [Candidatus Micrarchaeota archaeon]
MAVEQVAAGSVKQVLRQAVVSNACVVERHTREMSLNPVLQRAVVAEDILRRIERMPDFEARDFAKLPLTSEPSLQLREVASLLPPDLLFSCFGVDAVVWAYAETHPRAACDGLKEFLECKGFDGVALTKARAAAWTRSATSHAELFTAGRIKAAHDIMVRLQEAVSEIGLPAIVARNLLKPREATRYGLVSAVTRMYEIDGEDPRWDRKRLDDARTLNVYLDTPTGVILLYEGLPNAVATFFPTDAGQTLMIEQLQLIAPKPVNGKTVSRRLLSPKGLFDFDWKNAMVAACVEVARFFGFEKIGVQGGGLNKWVGEDFTFGLVHLDIEKAIEIYDDTAERMGFVKGVDGNWRKLVVECEKIF